MRFGLALDHLAVVAKTVEEGAAFVEAVLGVQPTRGGRHPEMGTHNQLLALGRDAYLEVIAVDPEARAPGRRRWFNLDSYSGPPRLMNWIARTDDLSAAIDAAPPGIGRPMRLARENLSWRMSIPDFGKLPYDDAVPALIQWDSGVHPAHALPDHDLALVRLDVFHPEVDAMLADFPQLREIEKVSFREGPEKRLIATIRTPEGNRILA